MPKCRHDEGFIEAYANCVQLKMPSNDGKQRFTDAADEKSGFFAEARSRFFAALELLFAGLPLAPNSS